MHHAKPETLDDLRLTVSDTPGPDWPGAADTGAARCNVFQTREFIAAWQASYGTDPGLRPLFVRVENSYGRPVALLPLVIRRHRAVSILSFLDQGQADYNGPVLYEGAAGNALLFTPAFWQRLFAALPRFDVALLEKLPALIGDLPNPMLTLGGAVVAPSGHGNLLTRPWPEVEAVLPSPKELRSKLRGLEKFGEVNLVIAEDEATRERLLASLVAQKQRWFDEQGLPGFTGKPLSFAFLKEATAAFALSGSLMLCGLIVDGEVTAIQWGLRQGTVFYGLLTSFEAGKWTKHSCGRVLNWLLLKRLHTDGFSFFDQGYGDEPYKLKSCDTTRALTTIEIGVTARGRLSLRLRRLLRQFEAHPLHQRLGDLARRLRRR